MRKSTAIRKILHRHALGKLFFTVAGVVVVVAHSNVQREENVAHQNYFGHWNSVHVRNGNRKCFETIESYNT